MAVRRRCRFLFCKINVRTGSCWSYPLWRAMAPLIIVDLTESLKYFSYPLGQYFGMKSQYSGMKIDFQIFHSKFLGPWNAHGVKLKRRASQLAMFNPIWHRRGYFYPLVLFGSDFVSWIFFKNFQTLMAVKIDINWVILKPSPLCLIKVAPRGL